MARKQSRSKRKTLGIKIKPKEGMWISYQLRLKGITGTSLAQRLGINQTSVSLIITGRRKSARVETALYQTLGYPSFEAMIAAARGKGGNA
jgi:transcriptional regulator with XRE-family HTH domain